MLTDPKFVILETKQTWTVCSHLLELSAFKSAGKITSEIFCASLLFFCPGKQPAQRFEGAPGAYGDSAAVAGGGGDDPRGLGRLGQQGDQVAESRGGQILDLCAWSNTHSKSGVMITSALSEAVQQRYLLSDPLPRGVLPHRKTQSLSPVLTIPYDGSKPDCAEAATP